MQARALGRSGLHVSRVALGTLTWGRETDTHEARDQLAAFAAAGGTLVDTADTYGDGRAEELLGSMLSDFPDTLVSSKAGTVKAPRRRDTSRAHLMRALDGSLQRLRRSHLDIWHVTGWDSRTPLDETLSVLEAAVTAGKVRYAGLSNMAGWQIATAGTAAHTVSAQLEYSLVARGIEREAVPASTQHGLGILAWSPLGRGVLTGKYRHATPADSRAASPATAPFVQPYLAERPRVIVDAVCTAAEGLGTTPASVALGWVLAQPFITSAIIGARTVGQLTAALAAGNQPLPPEIIDALDEVSAPEPASHDGMGL